MCLDLVGLHAGASVFLVLNGPSFARIDRDRLRRPGILTFGVNNGAHAFRPHYWTCVDDPTRFMESIWRDPTIVKFVPHSHIDRPLWDQAAGRVSLTRVRHCPNLVAFARNEQFEPARWLDEDTVNWGNHGDRGGGRSVMLSALRLCHLLGFRRVFLLGCDFHMAEDRKYWFPEHRSDPAIRHNNATYTQLRDYFTALRPAFDAAGFEVLNCTEDSHLDVFPHYPLAQALAETEIDTSASTEGMYVDRFRPNPDRTAAVSPGGNAAGAAAGEPEPHPDTARVRAAVLAAIGAAPVEADPFFHLTFQNVFPADVYAALHEHLPADDAYEELRHRDALRPDGSSARLHLILTPQSLAKLPDPIRAFWTPLHAALASPEVKTALFARHYPALFRRFGKKLKTLEVEPRISLIRDLAGYRIGIHQDIREKVITTQFYLPQDDSRAHIGTVFYRKNELATEEPKTDDPFELAKRIPFLPNSGYSFTVGKESWHGVDPLEEKDAPRESVMLVYYAEK
ncbi:MAG: hypothetical protein H7A52_04445 [Akkermansiaceae bacterium]|nr:hypothetical protein [Akkermansiaceae bacterium]